MGGTEIQNHKNSAQFGEYILMHTIGEGEFAKVKYAINKVSKKEFAIKLIKKSAVSNPLKLQKIKREVNILRDLAHPFIVKLEKVVETENVIGLVLKYASGVEYLHLNNIIHRDLKLENLMLDENKNLLITDFGFANTFAESKSDLMSTSCGSPCYAAPELVVSDGAYAGTLADIWSCGVIFYAMVCGFLPFDDDPQNPEGDNINLLYKFILKTKLTFPEHVGSKPRDLLGHILVPDPKKRCTIEFIKKHEVLKPVSKTFDTNKELIQKLVENPDFEKTTSRSIEFMALNDDKRKSRMINSLSSHDTGKYSKAVSSVSKNCLSRLSAHDNSSRKSDEQLMPQTPQQFVEEIALNPFDPETSLISFGNSMLQTSFLKENRSPQSKASHRNIAFGAIINNSRERKNDALFPKVHKQQRPVSFAPPFTNSTGINVNRTDTMTSHRRALSVTMDSNPASDIRNTTHDISTLRQSIYLPIDKKQNSKWSWIKNKNKTVSYYVPPERFSVMHNSSPYSFNAASYKQGQIIKLREHSGAIDQSALTSRSPPEIMHELRQIINESGFVILRDEEYMIKIIRPSKSIKATHGFHKYNLITGIKEFLKFGSSSNKIQTANSSQMYSAPENLYADATIDNGAEVKLKIEICAVKNFPNLFVLDVKRVKGNVWTFKFLYHLIMDKVQLGSSTAR